MVSIFLGEREKEKKKKKSYQINKEPNTDVFWGESSELYSTSSQVMFLSEKIREKRVEVEKNHLFTGYPY